jgi:NADH-quinone oxidoreductase subunit N
MTAGQLVLLLPLIVLLAAGNGIMILGAFTRSQRLLSVVTAVSLGIAGVLAVAVEGGPPEQYTPLLRLDGFSLLFTALVCATGVGVVAYAHRYLAAREETGEAFYVLLVFAVLGMAVLGASSHFVSFFLGLETLTVCLYVLIGYLEKERRSVDAGVKYLILAAASSAFLLFGIGLLYARYGALEFTQLADEMRSYPGMPDPVVLLGLALVFVGFGFKLSVVPFHLWVSDVYYGSPAPATALIATGSKGAMIALLARYLTVLDLMGDPLVRNMLFTLAIVTLFGGNLLALLERDVKRLLGFSSITQMGYFLIALLAGPPLGNQAAAFYLIAYFLMTLGAFGVVAVLSERGTEASSIQDYQGLARTRPWLAAALAVMLISLAGLPITVGFIGKLYVFYAAVQAGLYGLTIIGVVNAGISVFYYLRVVAAMYLRDAPGGRPAPAGFAWSPSYVVLGVLAFFVVALGAFPGPALSLVGRAIAWLP